MCTHGDPSAERLVQIRGLLAAQLHDAALVARIERAAAAVARSWGTSTVAQDFVADVIGDIYAGTLLWNPERVSLWSHVVSEVKRRVGRARRLAARHSALDLAAAAMTVPPHDIAGDDTVSATILEDVEFRAAGDTEVQQLLAFYLQGTTRKARILQLGMSDAVYRNARRRLQRLAIAAFNATNRELTRDSAIHHTSRDACTDTFGTPEQTTAQRKADDTRRPAAPDL